MSLVLTAIYAPALFSMLAARQFSRRRGPMEIGIVGLGKMGSSLALQALGKNIRVVGYSTAISNETQLRQNGIEFAKDLESLTLSLGSPRKVFLYVPSGISVDRILDELIHRLAPGDVVIDAGNSHFRDSIARQARLAAHDIGFVDAGSSGGPEGALSGACFMVGGERKDVAIVEPVLKSLSVPEGFLHVGQSGSGHFVKLIHNAIEFGMLQAIGEGVSLLQASEFKIDLPALFHNWSHGSVIRGWLTELMEKELRENPDLHRVPAHVEDTGEVNWALEEAIRLEVPIPIIMQSVLELFRSRDKREIDHKSVALLRHGFGGHPFGPDRAIQEERQKGKVGLS